MAAIDAERTFWKQAPILHQPAGRTDLLAASDVGRYEAAVTRMVADLGGTV